MTHMGFPKIRIVLSWGGKLQGLHFFVFTGAPAFGRHILNLGIQVLAPV